MLVAQFNTCVSLVAPAHILYDVVVCALVIYFEMTMYFGPIPSISMATFLLAMFLFICFVGGCLSKIKPTSKELLVNAKNLCHSIKYCKLVNQSCQPFKIWIGIFGTFPDDFVVLWLLETLNFTIAMFLM